MHTPTTHMRGDPVSIGKARSHTTSSCRFCISFATDIVSYMRHLCIYDDTSPYLAPINDLRSAAEIRTGMLTTAERWKQWAASNGFTITDPLHSELNDSVASESLTDVTYVQARCPLPPEQLSTLAIGHALRDSKDNTIAAARCETKFTSTATLARAMSGESTHFDESARSHYLLSRPWHVRTFRDACIASDSRLFAGTIPHATVGPHSLVITRSSTSGTVHQLHAHESARIYGATIFDCENGPIFLDEKAVIRPGAQLIGPCYVGKNSTVLERATIRPGTCIGPWCKVNGEVGGTIFQGFANKAHDGYVGDSYIGEWVNLGAGTTTSNLLNTYGEVVAKQSAQCGNERTGEQFLGSIIGDHTKTAICTRLMTGTIIHTGAMIASTAPATGCIPPFAWITDAPYRSYRIEKFIEVMIAAMARRNITPAPEYKEKMLRLHAQATTKPGVKD